MHSTCVSGSSTDPFAAAPTHMGGGVCGGTNCRTLDTRITCCLAAADFGTGGSLLDACSYPSSNPNSDPSDCIATSECTTNADCNDNNPCTVDACNTGIGFCTHIAGNQGTQCRGPAGVCDEAEVCDGDSPFCPADGFAQIGTCRNATDLCDVAESCDGSGPDCPADGVAQQGTPCRPDGGQCDVGEVCDGNSKVCPADGFEPNNTPCSDGSECTTGDLCTGGVCVGGPAPDCEDNNVCTDDTCNPSTPGGCEHTNNSAPCSDGSECTTGDACSGGSCVGGPAPDCEDNNVCTDDSCNPSTPGGCVNTNNSAPCDDSSDCTTNDTCSGGSCAGGPPPSCDDGLFCTADSCPDANGCQHLSDPDCCEDDSGCTDVDECTVNERCESHLCVSDPRTCNDTNDCTDDSCNPTTPGGCVFTNNSNPCSDGSECTTGDACSGGSCVGGPAPDCEDNNVCTDDSCNPSTPGGCVNTNNTTPCSDGSECTTDDACSGGSCVGGPAPDCEDSNVCTDDSCNPSTPGGCEHANNTGPCDDGNGCSVDDTCSGGICHSGGPKDCNDLNLCTDDSCSPPSGDCINMNNAQPCDDGDVCTIDDICGGGSCQPGDPKDCNDSLGCTNDFCTPMTDCQHEPVVGPCCDFDSECIDSDGCTENERCVDNACVSDPVDCADDDECTVDTCNNDGGGFLCVSTDCLDLPDPLTACPGPQCFPDFCGNGVVEASNNETCDPPDPTPIPGVVPTQQTCRSDCTSCGDGNVDTDHMETCDDGNTVSGCRPDQPQKPLDDCLNSCSQAICEDPAKVLLAQWVDRFDFHGRLTTTEQIDFTTRSFVIQLTTHTGKVIYRASLPAGAITSLSGTPQGPFKFKYKEAKLYGGVQKLKIKRQSDGNYRATVKGYGNLYSSQAEMVTHVYAAGHEWTVVGTWEKRPKGWRFR